MSELILPWFSTIELIVTRWISPILVIGVLVFIHELGHFLLAKFCGVGVVKFSVGFGPAIFKFRHRETIYQLSIIPLGGFVRMVGDMPDMITGPQATDEIVREGELPDDETLEANLGVKMNPELKASLSDRSKWFIEKNYWQKSAIVFAGPFFNFMLAIFLVIVSVSLYGQEELSDQPVIGAVMHDSPADVSGLKMGDLVYQVNGAEVKTWEELAKAIHDSEGGEVKLDVRRATETLNLVVTPQAQTVKLMTGGEKKAYFIGINRKSTRVESNFLDAVKIGFLWTYDTSKLTLSGIWGMIRGKGSKSDLAGPIFIFEAVGEKAEQGLESVIHLTALLSISLGVLNLLPIPVLDGGHLLFFLIEAIIGPISIRKKEIAQSVGMLLLLAVMVFAVSNDLTRDSNKTSQDFKWDQPKK